jgi:hypothetical protein
MQISRLVPKIKPARRRPRRAGLLAAGPDAAKDAAGCRRRVIVGVISTGVVISVCIAIIIIISLGQSSRD